MEQTPEQTAKREAGGARRGWPSALVTGVALVALVGGFMWVAWGPGTAFPSRAYHDSLGLFSIRMPLGWTVKVSPGGYGVGDRTGSTSGPDEDVFFSDPAQGGGSASLWVHADQITSDYGRVMFCHNFRAQETTSFNGYPAADTGAGWLFESNSAHFQVAATIPGVTAIASLGHANPNAPRPTPIPAAWARADQSLLDAMLASLAPSAAPLHCY